MEKTLRQKERPVHLTSQNEHFPINWGYCSHLEYEDFEQRLNNQLFTIHDDLLYSCITYGDGLKHSLVRGFTHTKDGLGYALLSFFTSRALGLYRLPFCPERTYEFLPGPYNGRDALHALLAELTPKRIDIICAELQALYRHTQRLLQEADLASVHLKRNVRDIPDRHRGNLIGYAELLFKLKEASELTGHKTLRFEMDVLNSYGDGDGYRHYPVTIRHEVPAKDVVYCSNFIRSRDHSYGGGHNMAVEDGEWVVINRAADGVVELPVSAIELNTPEWVDRWKRRSCEIKSAEQFIADWNPAVLRGLASLGIEKRFHGSGLRLRPMSRLRAAFEILRTGRSQFD